MSHVPEGHEATERDLNGLEQGADRNLIKFNKEKCKVLHLGRNNPMHRYMMGTTPLKSSFAEKDLVVLVGTKLTTRQQYALVAEAASIRQRTASRSGEVILPLCSALVRQPWSAGSSPALPRTREI